VAASAIPVAISFVPWIATTLFRSASYMVFRSLLHVPVYAVTVVCASMLIRGLARRDARAWCIGVPAAAVWLFVFFRPVPSAIADDLRARARADGADAAETELIHAVAALPAGAVVLSDPATSYVLSAWTSHRFVAVYQQHGNPRDRFPLERVRSVRDVLSPFAGPDAAVAAARRFNVDYVVVNRTPPSDDLEFLRAWQGSSYEAALHRMTALAPSFAPIDTAGNAVIFRFHGAAPVSHSYTTQVQPVVVSERPLSPCEVSAPHDAFAITGISVSPERALPGDALQVTLGYVRDAPIPFQLPVVIHVRFDNEAVSSAREFPGDKQWRRWRDRRERTRSRFREDFLPGHGVYDPDLWPTGVALAETFTAVVPESARHGRYRVEVSIEPLTQIPNFHARDLLFNRDHYSGKACATLEVSGHAVGTGASP
jgi:hypothetical protein